MDAIFTSVLPLFSVIFLGFFAGKAKILDQVGVRALVAFVFTIAMPALLFRMMASIDIASITDWPVLFIYLIAQIPIFVGGLFMGRFLFKQSFAEMTIQGFGSSFSNGVILGLPLALSLYGDEGGIPALLIIMLDILLFSSVTLMLELATLHRHGNRPQRPLQLASDMMRSVLKNPLIIATSLGIIWSLVGIPLPSAIDKTLSFAGQAAPPAGLFALGASLSLRKIRGNVRPISAMIAMKLFLHPVIALVLASYVFNLNPIAMSVLVLVAACPVGANTYIFAEQYEAGAETAAAAVLISTGLSMFTVSALIVFLNMIPK